MFFGLSGILLSLYLAIGLFLSQFLHIHVYQNRGATTLQTWWSNFGIFDFKPSVGLVKMLCLILIVIAFFSMQIIYYKAGKWNGLTILNNGAIVLLVICVFSQLIFSSVMRLNYEILICFIPLIYILLDKTFLQPANISAIDSSKLNELWDLLKFVTPICIGIPIIMGGVGFISSFYQGEQSVMRLQLYRHISMALYIEFGTIYFIVYPIFKKILIIKNL